MESVAAGLPADDSLLEGERPETPYLDDIRHWITIYNELQAFTERSLNRTRQALAHRVGSSRNPLAVDERMLELHLDRFRRRLSYWRERLNELGGIDFDPQRRRLAHGGHVVALTRREAELFAYLLANPNRFFSAGQLVADAWQAPELSTEQLRSYVVRLRRHLQALNLPCRLISEPRQGYALSTAGR